MSQERVSGFPDKGLTSGEVRETSGEVRGTSGEVWKLPGNLWLLSSSTVRELPGKHPKASGEVRGTSGEAWGLSRSSGELDSLPATRQMYLQHFDGITSRARGLRQITSESPPESLATSLPHNLVVVPCLSLSQRQRRLTEG